MSVSPVAAITARTAFQVYKDEDNFGNVSDFNSLPADMVLPYKIIAAEEALVSSLDVVEGSAEACAKYAVSTLHAASSYLQLLASYMPLMARSQYVRHVDINHDAIVRIVMLFSEDVGLLERVKELVLRNGGGGGGGGEAAPAGVPLAVLSDIEGAMVALEKQYRQRYRESGTRIEMLRKVAPERQVEQPVAAAASAPSSGTSGGRRSSVSPPRTVATQALSVEREVTSTPVLSPAPRPVVTMAALSHSPRPMQTPSHKRDRSDDAPALAEAPGESGHDTCATSGDTGETTEAGTARERKKPARARAPAALSSFWVWGRLRALTTAEKKAVAALNQMLVLLAHIYATRYNNLVPIFDHLQGVVAQVQTIVDAERAAYAAKAEKKPPEPFHELSLNELRQALAASEHSFREDEDCRYELDEDLLHPIAHACLGVINHIEGYRTAPFVPPSEDELRKKHAARAAARAKREAVQRRVLERAKAREALAQRRLEERRLLRQSLGGDVLDAAQLQEDGELGDPVPTAYVAYDHVIPLESVAAFEQALFVWTMLVSVPRPLKLSQMPFALFLKALQNEDQESNGLMEEITRCLLNASMDYLRSTSSPNLPRIATRGKTWFDALVEFVAVASGNRKKKRQQRPPSSSFSSSSSSDDDDASESESLTEEDDHDDKSDEEETEQDAHSDATRKEGDDGAPADDKTREQEGKPPTAGAAEAEAPAEGFDHALAETLQRVAELRSMATWGNVDLEDRLNLLQFCVQEALAGDALREEADKLLREQDEDKVSFEKRMKEIYEEAEKEMKQLLRAYTGARMARCAGGTNRRGLASAAAQASEAAKEGGEDDQEAAAFETRRNALLATAARRRREACMHYYGKQDSQDIGAIIEPLGMDRYKRLYWRLPLERRIFVQTTTVTQPNFPLLPAPPEAKTTAATSAVASMNGAATLPASSRLLLDDEAADLASGHRGKARGATSYDSARSNNYSSASDDYLAQRVWGVIAPAHLASFVAGLDPRGEREGPLRKALIELQPYVQSLPEPHEGMVTRARAHTYGYINRLADDM